MKNTKKPRYLGSKSNVKSSPDSFILDCVNNPHLDHDYSIRFIAPEFTSICPITSQPDFGKIIIDYVPNKLLMESKSFKLFLFSFRDYGGFHEDCTIKISKKIIKYVKPKWIRVASFWNPRGGIPIDIISQTGKKPVNVIVSELNIPIYGNR
ncbi:MAG: NADPH-dependent 7-cyano-7-deazaguanine reductase QueF [Pelagibacteraceae bacterium TMED65]|nr:NADPH-dependent 7-cyano-7-deazaguanine reductase QueF [Rickettsiales bacterium]OUU52900.1 MAG: NADPH-dependent 7-cyano-7-deazaguanine reductase QueF [Pelagibacteraceae bacterium TMED65]|tara:strand:+ start:1434 stop:1889 length:456 start_codon:yes stop_codon:yes gene_type:complete